MDPYAYVVYGDAQETNIFLPGTGWAGEFGMPVAEALGEGYATHMLDLPGIGKSQGIKRGVLKPGEVADWLNSYMELHGLQQANIIGHSLGGIIGLFYAYYYPEKVNKLILLDIGYAKIERFPVAMMGSVGYVIPLISMLHRLLGEKVLGQESEEHGALAEKTEAQVMKTIVDLGLEDTPFIRMAIHTLQRSSTLEGISLLLTAYRTHLPKMVKSLKVPCLLLYGSRLDRPEKIQRRLRRNIAKLQKAGVHTHALIGGHYAHVGDVSANEAIASFLKNNQRHKTLVPFFAAKDPFLNNSA